ncbi:MAG: hypothetical protein HOO06_00955 [Bdellovibrionaceae bacterium]|jgi:hypothetical protein|nr:hypothetical protein [Pseudobdellovibrionaceae bacterium]
MKPTLLTLLIVSILYISPQIWAKTCIQTFSQVENSNKSPDAIFGARSPHDFNSKDYDEVQILPMRSRIIPWLRWATGTIDISPKNSIKIFEAKSELIKNEFLNAVKSGEAKLLGEAYDEPILHMWADINGIVMGETYNKNFFHHALRHRDKLYAFEGELIRLRPNDSSVFILPRKLHHYAAKYLDGVSVFRIRSSWIESNFIPRFPIYKDNLADHLNLEYSSWHKVEQGYQLQFQKGLYQGGYLYIRVEFRDTTTFVHIKSRPEGKSEYSQRTEKEANDFLQRISKSENLSSLSLLAQISLMNRVLEWEAGSQTSNFLIDLINSSHFEPDNPRW